MIRKCGLFAIATFVCLSLMFMFGCSKDDDDYDFDYMDGTLTFDLDFYVAPGSTVVLEPKGLSHPLGGEITYIWTVTPDIAEETKDTIFTFTYTFNDTLQSYEVVCMAVADGYISSTCTVTTMTVLGGLDGNGSLTDSVGRAVVNLSRMGSIIDNREEKEKVYYYTGFNGYDWLIQNLEYRGVDNSVGMAYLETDVTNDVFGTYYTYEEALTACPEGWKLPTVEEWDKSITFDSGSVMANVYFNGMKMWEFWPSVKISNNSFFTAIPVGEVNLQSKTFTGMRSRAVFWTADEFDEERAIVKYFVDDQTIMYETTVYKDSFGASVRCIRNGKSNIPF